MIEKYHLKSRKLLKIAKQIFGSLVISAYVENWDKSRLQRISKSFDETSKIIHYDGDTIILQFSNGNLVRFTNSEWANISKIETLNLIEN